MMDIEIQRPEVQKMILPANCSEDTTASEDATVDRKVPK